MFLLRRRSQSGGKGCGGTVATFPPKLGRLVSETRSEELKQENRCGCNRGCHVLLQVPSFLSKSSSSF
jgi:hypothetical protein